jgi:hypothetical protein
MQKHKNNNIYIQIRRHHHTSRNKTNAIGINKTFVYLIVILVRYFYNPKSLLNSLVLF